MNRRVQRTRLELLAAFRNLVFERAYDKIRVADISRKADVGRSTFYEHFESKNDILEHSLIALLTVLAEAIGQPQVPENLRSLCEHFWENRSAARPMLSGATRCVVSQLLSELVKERLALLLSSTPGATPLLPLDFIASHLAENQLALIDSWLTGGCCSPEAFAHALHATTNASASALLNRA